MKNLSRLLALIMALCMLMSVSVFASAEPSAEPSGEPSGEASGESVEDAFIDYIHEWLLAELAVNGQMTIEQVEDEFMPLVREMNFVDFPAEMIYSGMLEQGVPMTFEEFAAQYKPASGEASGEAGGYTADEAGYKAYLKDWVTANPAVQANLDEFIAGIDAGAYAEFPMEMCFTDQWFGFAALTGAAEIPAFDPNLAPD